MAEVCILATGGTIDKEHDPISEELIFHNTSHIPSMLNEFRVEKIPYEVIMLKDSLDFTADDRSVVTLAAKHNPHENIVITHGTSTMAETAAAIAVENLAKTIVLTGAMRPFSLFKSDAGFNLGGALIAAQTLPHGVYIVMNGRVFTADDVTKDTTLGKFTRPSRQEHPSLAKPLKC